MRIAANIVVQAIDLFISNADFVPNVPRVDAGQPLYASYRFVEEEWILIHKIYNVLEVCITYLNKLMLIIFHRNRARFTSSFLLKRYHLFGRFFLLLKTSCTDGKSFR